MSHNRKCQYLHCAKVVENPKQLRACGKCRGARYCSKDCQRQDWPSHKATCRIQESMTKAAAEVTIRGENTADGFNVLKLGRDLRKWSDRHLGWISNVGCQALRIWEPDSTWRSDAVVIELETHNIAPDSDDIPYMFTFNSAIVIACDEISRLATNEPNTTRSEQSQHILQVIQQQHDDIANGVGGKKVSLIVLTVLMTSGQLIFAPHVILEENFQNFAQECPSWKEAAKLTLQISHNPDYSKIDRHLSAHWIPKNENALKFIAVNCLNLKVNPTRNRTHLVEIQTIITKTSGGGYTFTPLKAIETTFTAYLALSVSSGAPQGTAFKETLLDGLRRCQNPEYLGSEQGRWVIISLRYGKGISLIPIFVSNILLALIVTRVDWQEHKYRLLSN